MKTKLVLWGTNESDERVLIALALRAEENKVDTWIFPEKVVTEEFSQKMMREWRNGVEIEFPEENTHSEKELSVTESLLPETLKVERGDVVQRAQTEWHFVVLSSKLNQVYQTELGELQEKIDSLEEYSQDAWDNLKEFWGKVQGQVRERNLFRDHADSLRDNTNSLFSKMKELRSKMDDDFKIRSQEAVDKVTSILEDLEKKVEDGFRLQGIFEELKKVQRNFRETKLTREHRNHLWGRIDGAFKKVKAKRFGDNAVMESSPIQRLNRRYQGLIAAIQKMESSINRDREDLGFQKRKIERSDGQLEAQIRQAKIVMIEERIRSKEEKLNEMKNTQTELEQKIEAQKTRDAKRAERDAREAAKVAAKEKIAQKIQAAEAARGNETEKLEKAAEAITKKEEKPAEPKPADESILAAAGTMLGESLTDVMDTVKAVAEVVSDRVEEAVEELKEEVTETIEEVKEAISSEEE